MIAYIKMIKHHQYTFFVDSIEYYKYERASFDVKDALFLFLYRFYHVSRPMVTGRYFKKCILFPPEQFFPYQ